MKKLMALAALAASITMYAATYKQASQAWVEMKISEMEARIMGNISAAASATNEQEAASAILNSSTRSISDGMDIASAVTTTSAYTPTSGVPYYAIGFVPESMTNIIQRGSILNQQSSGVFTNAVATLTEGAITNTLSVTGIPQELVCPDGGYLYYASDPSDSITAFKAYR